MLSANLSCSFLEDYYCNILEHIKYVSESHLIWRQYVSGDFDVCLQKDTKHCSYATDVVIILIVLVVADHQNIAALYGVFLETKIH